MYSKKNYVRISESIYADEAIRELPEAFVLRYIFLIAWSKQHQREGVFTKLAVSQCGGTQEEIAGLIAAGLVTINPDGTWSIVDFLDWQNTTVTEEVREKKRIAGSLGGKQKAENEALRGVAAASNSNFPHEEHFAELYSLWPSAKDRKENKDYAIQAYKACVNSEEDHAAVLDGLRGFLAVRKTWPKEIQAKLPYFSNFLKEGKWERYVGTSAPAMVVDPGYDALDVPESDTDRQMREMIEADIAKHKGLS